MFARSFLVASFLSTVVGLAAAQAPRTDVGDQPATGWRSVGDGTPSVARAAPAPAAPAPTTPAPASADRAATTSVPAPAGPAALPNDRGQVWRDYDISDYTLRVTSTERPEQAIVDWILRETGYEAWHGETLSILSCGPRKLRVYHTPEMQAVVAGVVDRFVGSQAESRAFALRIVTVDQPNWRAKAQGLLRAVEVQTPGVQAWVLQKENAAILLADLRRRSDYREHSSPHLLVNNGQSTVVSSMRGRDYIRDVTLRSDAWPGFQQQTGQVDEGFSLEFCPLLSLDGGTIDATVKCTVTQVEKMVSVTLDVPTTVAPRQRTTIEVPQISHFRFHERFRWPTEQVLLIGMGMVALPTPNAGKPLVAGIPLPLGTSPARADLLVFVEGRGKTADTPQDTRSAGREAKTYHGRY
ncbi:MAG: hypothetical protein NTW96_07715 [Planctomycetia bacterium]|nr:hypothetical protein [Planctomycetia bacterium]